MTRYTHHIPVDHWEWAQNPQALVRMVLHSMGCAWDLHQAGIRSSGSPPRTIEVPHYTSIRRIDDCIEFEFRSEES